MSRFNFCDCPAGFSAAPERHAPDCPGRFGAGKRGTTLLPATVKPDGEPKPYPDRLCHIDYAAHPYRCGCLHGDDEAQRRFYEHQLTAPVQAESYPAVRRVKAHTHTCSYVTGDSGACDCGAVVNGVAVEVPQGDVSDLVEHCHLQRAKLAESDVARLTAERDALQERLNAADQRADDLETQLAATEQSRRAWFDSSQAADKQIDDLAELLRRCVMAVREQHCDQDDAEFDLPVGLMADIDAKLSAKQDDDWRMNPCNQGHRDVGAAGGVAHCYTCDEKIEAATTQEAFEQWNATHAAPEAKP